MTKDKSMICENYESVCHSSGEEAGLLGVLLGGRPAGKHEADLVDQVGNVVDDVEGGLVGNTGQEAQEVAERVDGPANAHDEAHVGERLLHCFALVTERGRCLGGAASEHLEEDEEPAAQAKDESRPAEAWGGLANVTEDEHEHGAEEELPESSGLVLGASGLQDQVELNHLQRDGDAPVDVPC